MRDLVQIEVYKEIYKGKPKQWVMDKFLYSFLIDLTDNNWSYGGFYVAEETLKRHGKGHSVLAQDFKDLGNDGLIDCNKSHTVIDFYDLNDPI